MWLNIKYLFLISLLLISGRGNTQPNVYSWNNPSLNSSESMPCGGGDIGLNVWVEKGDLLFYISRSGTYDEQNTLLKQGRVRLKLLPDPFTGSTNFHQTLQLDQGSVEITSNGTRILLWVDVHKPVIHVNIQSKSSVFAELHYENWRYRDRLIRKGEGQQNSWKWAPPAGLVMKADSIRAENNEITFYHQNGANSIFDVAVAQQGMQNVQNELMNPLANLVSGGKMWSKQMQFSGSSGGTYAGTDYRSWVLKTTKKQKNIAISIALHTQQTPEPSNWHTGLEQTIAKIQPEKDRKISTQWWNDFYNRSFIRAEGEAAAITRNYNLFHYMLGCNATGSDPTKFNGGLFTFDPVYVDEKQAFTPDYRKWGGGTFTAQNQRLVYWPMLKSGDVSLMLPQFNFYLRMLRNAELRSQTYWGHAGASFTEQTENFGLPNPAEYGFKRPENFDKGVEYNAWLEYQWDTVLEFCQMMLESKNYSNADISAYMPLIKSVITFFDQHYTYQASQRGRKSLDGDGKLILYPASACETYKMANNPAPMVAGLRRVISTMGDPDSLLKKIPELSIYEKDGRKMIAPAKSWERINNVETPQLYPVFPWRWYGVGKANIETAINTWQFDEDALKFRSHKGWKQDNIWAACLGLTDEAKRLNLLKLADGPHRFPAFWGPDFDWTPDHNRGGSGMIGLQEMLLQTTDDGKILLFPAWPADWNVHFKLHAPGNTVIEGELKDGKLKNLIVTPEIRQKDIIFGRQIQISNLQQHNHER